MLNRFCQLSKKNPLLLFLLDNIKLDGIPTKTEWKTQVYFTLYFKF